MAVADWIIQWRPDLIGGTFCGSIRPKVECSLVGIGLGTYGNA